MNKKRIGFACKWIDRPDQVGGIHPKDDCKKFNTGGTTVSWLNRQTKDAATQKLWDIMVKNIESVRLLIEKVGSLDGNLRMVRLSSDLLPVYTEPTWSWFGVGLTLAVMLKSTLERSVAALVSLGFACLFIQGNLQFWPAIIKTLLTEV